MFWWVVSQDEKRRQPDGPEAIVRGEGKRDITDIDRS